MWAGGTQWSLITNLILIFLIPLLVFYYSILRMYLKKAKALRCMINRAIEFSKASLVKASLEDTKKDPKKIWRIINSVIKPEMEVKPPVLIGENGFIKTNQECGLPEYFLLWRR